MMTEKHVGNGSWEIAICSEQSVLPIAEARLREAIDGVLGESSFGSAEISVAVVDDATIHQLNRKFLDHDYATDVLSFVLEQDGDHLVGEIVVSAETACSASSWYEWNAETELLLYVIHGALHLVGYDDVTDDDRAEMRRIELRHLEHLGVTMPQTADDPPPNGQEGSAGTKATAGGARGDGST